MHKKAIYYDGYDQEDVVKDHQEWFLPSMAEYRERLVEHKMGCLTEEVMKSIPIGVWRLVLVVHDESTSTAKDGPKASWVQDGEQPILKKGVGQGCH